jgi:hypothetical protein
MFYQVRSDPDPNPDPNPNPNPNPNPMLSGQVESESEKNGSDPHHCFLNHFVNVLSNCYMTGHVHLRILLNDPLKEPYFFL